MTNFNLDQADVIEMNTLELMDTDGGLFPIIILGVTLLTASETGAILLAGIGIGAAVAQGQKH